MKLTSKNIIDLSDEFCFLLSILENLILILRFDFNIVISIAKKVIPWLRFVGEFQRSWYSWGWALNLTLDLPLNLTRNLTLISS